MRSDRLRSDHPVHQLAPRHTAGLALWNGTSVRMRAIGAAYIVVLVRSAAKMEIRTKNELVSRDPVVVAATATVGHALRLASCRGRLRARRRTWRPAGGVRRLSRLIGWPTTGVAEAIRTVLG